MDIIAGGKLHILYELERVADRLDLSGHGNGVCRGNRNRPRRQSESEKGMVDRYSHCLLGIAHIF
jgi:hypothetical protein